VQTEWMNHAKEQKQLPFSSAADRKFRNVEIIMTIATIFGSK
jgi:hypothetical protein